jgi:hypothetical protein
MDVPEQHYFKEFACEMFPGWENDFVVYEAARAAWKQSGTLASKAAIIARWEDECN